MHFKSLKVYSCKEVDLEKLLSFSDSSFAKNDFLKTYFQGLYIFSTLPQHSFTVKGRQKRWDEKKL